MRKLCQLDLPSATIASLHEIAMARLRTALGGKLCGGKICFDSPSVSSASADWQKIVKRCVDFAPHGVGMGPALVEAGEKVEKHVSSPVHD